VDASIDPAGHDDTSLSGQALFVEHLSTIQNLLAAVARQHGLSQDDAETFRSTALVRIIDDDFAVLRRFGGRRSWRAYLAVVVQRMCLDFRIAQWRNGLTARRLGSS
jgi:hypothetical protein